MSKLVGKFFRLLEIFLNQMEIIKMKKNKRTAISSLLCLTALTSILSLSAKAEFQQVNQSPSPQDLSSMIESMIPSYGPTFGEPPSDILMDVPVFSRQSFFKFEEVIGYLHSQVEAETDVIYLINTFDRATSCRNRDLNSIPAQHMVVLKRNSESDSFFERDGRGKIIDFNRQGVQILALERNGATINYKGNPEFLSVNDVSHSNLTEYVPISSGINSGKKILTYSGIFRINERRTNDRRKSTNTIQDPMQYSVYINGQYNDGREAALALHGTSSNYWPLLGKQRASSGCIRMHSDFSKWNQSFLFGKSFDGQLVPRDELTGDIRLWNRVNLFPPAESDFSSLPRGRKLKALVVMFDGYKSQCL